MALVLREIGRKRCIQMAESLEQYLGSDSALHFRDLDLNQSDIQLIASCLKQYSHSGHPSLRSVSLSYNPLLGDAGVVYVLDSLPSSITELGLVQCGMSDDGANAVISRMGNWPHLKMVCLEQNNYSEYMRQKIRSFSMGSQGVSIIY